MTEYLQTHANLSPRIASAMQAVEMQPGEEPVVTMPKFSELFDIQTLSVAETTARADQLDAELRSAGPEGKWVFTNGRSFYWQQSVGKFNAANVKDQRVVLHDLEGGEVDFLKAPELVTSAESAVQAIRAGIEVTALYRSFGVMRDCLRDESGLLSKQDMRRVVERYADEQQMINRLPIGSAQLQEEFNNSHPFALVGEGAINDLLDFFAKEYQQQRYSMMERDDFMAAVALRGTDKKESNPFLDIPPLEESNNFPVMLEQLVKAGFPVRSSLPQVQEAYEVRKARQEMEDLAPLEEGVWLQHSSVTAHDVD